MEDSGKVVIHSFRLVFDRGYRRLFKIDRYRLPFAYGLPILGIVYAVLVALGLVVADKLPVAGPALAALPPPLPRAGPRGGWWSPKSSPPRPRHSGRPRRRSTGSRSRSASRW